MKIFEINLPHETFYCPVTGACLQTDTDGFADDVPSVVGYWIGEVVEEPIIKDENLQEAWDVFVENDGSDDMPTRFLSEYNNLNWVVFELTTSGIACGPMSSTIWYVINLAYEVPPVNVLGYRVQLEAQRIDNFIPAGHNCLGARKEALELVKSLKQIAHSFDGIKLSIEYAKTSNPDLTESHSILTGDKMHSEDILVALDNEAEVLSAAMQKFSEMITTNVDGKNYRSVDIGFTLLYYFTAN